MLQTKEDKQDKKGMSPLAAGVAGAVVGVGIAVAGAVALKDEKNRAKVKGALKAVKKQANGYVDKLQKEADKHQDKAKEKVDEVKKIATPKSS
jgi:hypothetical protein